MKHEFFDHHREGTSLVHLFDPRLKLIMLLTYVLLVVMIPYSLKELFLVYLLVPVILALISGVSPIHFLSKLIKLYPMILIISILVPFFPGGSEVVWGMGFLKIYREGLEKFLLINVKSVLALMMTIVLISTTDLSLFLRGMEKLRIPRLIIAILSFMYRFIFLLVDEVERMLMAYQSRYLSLSLRRRLGTLGNLIGMLFIRTYERGERIYLAMESRGFTGNIYTLQALQWKNSDSFAALLFMIVMLGPLLLIIRI